MAKTFSASDGRWIVGAGAIFKRLHIAFATGESEEAALMIDQVFHLVGAQFLRAKKIDKDPRVEITGARAHRDSTGGSEPHGGVDRYAIAKSAETCSVAEMREDGSFGQLSRRSDGRATRRRGRGNRSVEHPRRSSAAGVVDAMRLPAWFGEIHRQNRRIASLKERCDCAEAISDRACGMCSGAKCVAARSSSRTCGVMS